MAATARLLDEAGDSTLVLFDELGAGTDPLEGAALGCALLEELSRRRARHRRFDPSRADRALGEHGRPHGQRRDGVRRGNPAADLCAGGRATRPLAGAGDCRHRMGLPLSVLDRARELLGGDHLELDRWLRRLEALEMQLEGERSEVSLLRAEADGARREAEREFQRLEDERKKVPEMLAKEREELRLRAKKKLDTAVARLQRAMDEQEALGRRRLQKLRDEALRLDPPSPKSPEQGDGLAEGARVRLAVGGKGVLREIRGSRARVDVAGKRLWVPVAELTAGRRTTASTAIRGQGRIG